jgi:hypothetical protein
MKTQRAENRFHVAVRHIRAHHPQQFFARKLDFLFRRAMRVPIHNSRKKFAAGDFLNQFGGAARSQLRHFRIGAAFEAIRSLRAQPQRFGSAANGNGIEPGALDQYVARAETDFGFGAAHHASDAHGARGIRYHAHLFRERAFGAIERADFFAGFRAANDDAVFLQFIESESVQGVAELEHHVIRDVHHIVDGFFADRFEALPQPIR